MSDNQKRVEEAALAIFRGRKGDMTDLVPDVMHCLELTCAAVILSVADSDPRKASEIANLLAERLDFRFASFANKKGKTNGSR